MAEHRDPIHDAIVDAYNGANGDRSAFEHAIRLDNRVKFLSPIMIVAILRIAIVLWDLWRSTKVNPGEDLPVSQTELERLVWVSPINANQGNEIP